MAILKRLTSALLTGTLILSLAACSTGTDNTDGTGGTDGTTTAGGTGTSGSESEGSDTQGTGDEREPYTFTMYYNYDW